jgi:iron complex transport system permease protein
MEYLISRVLSSFLTGVIISQSGSLIQMCTRNILASPSTLGFDGLSVLWILVAHSVLLLFNHDLPLFFLFLAGVPFFILIGMIFSFFMLKQRRIDKLILVGLTFNLLVGAIFSLWHFLFMAFNLPFPAELWFGHFRFANLESFIILFCVEIFIISGWILLKSEIKLFSLGNAVSLNLRLNVKHVFLFIFVTIAIGTFGVVTLFGVFSFLGLIFPIISRKLWFQKYDIQGEFLWGSLFNGILLMLIDAFCYFFPIMGAEIPVGLIATAVGALSLILMLWRSDNRLEILAKRLK